MRVKSITFGVCGDDGDHEIFLVVPLHVTPEDVMNCQLHGEPHDCLCECYCLEDAERIVSLWNEKYGVN